MLTKEWFQGRSCRREGEALSHISLLGVIFNDWWLGTGGEDKNPDHRNKASKRQVLSFIRDPRHFSRQSISHRGLREAWTVCQARELQIVKVIIIFLIEGLSLLSKITQLSKISLDFIVFFDIKGRFQKSGSFYHVMLNLVQHLTSWTHLVRSRIKSGMTGLVVKNLFWRRVTKSRIPINTSGFFDNGGWDD